MRDRSRPLDAPHKPLTMRDLGRELRDEFLSLDRGLPYTFARLFADPGGTIRRYVAARDPRITRPVRYFLIASGVLAATLYALRRAIERVAAIEDGGRAIAVANFALENLLLVNATTTAASGLVLWLVFRRRRPTIAESLVVAAYVGAQTMWINAVFAPALLAGPGVLKPMAAAGGILMLVYTLWAWGAYFGGRLRDYALALVTLCGTQLALGLVALAAARFFGFGT